MLLKTSWVPWKNRPVRITLPLKEAVFLASLLEFTDRESHLFEDRVTDEEFDVAVRLSSGLYDVIPEEYTENPYTNDYV